MNGGKRVLVVDDDDSIRDIIDMALSDEGYEVRTAADGSSALTLLQQWQPDVILLDMRMPGTDGWAFADAYRQRPEPRPAIIVLTAAGDASTWAGEIEAEDVLAKPFDLEDLLDIVGRYAASSGSRVS